MHWTDSYRSLVSKGANLVRPLAPWAPKRVGCGGNPILKYGKFVPTPYRRALYASRVKLVRTLQIVQHHVKLAAMVGGALTPYQL